MKKAASSKSAAKDHYATEGPRNFSEYHRIKQQKSLGPLENHTYNRLGNQARRDYKLLSEFELDDHDLDKKTEAIKDYDDQLNMIPFNNKTEKGITKGFEQLKDVYMWRR